MSEAVGALPFSDAPASLRRALEALGARASRVLSSRAQVRFELDLETLTLARADALSAAQGGLGRSVLFVTPGGDTVGFVSISRVLAFVLLELRFGARPDAIGTAIPERPYTQIEERAVLRVAGDLWRAFSAEASDALPRETRVGGLIDAESLRTRTPDLLWMATFKTTGLGDVPGFSLAILPVAVGSASEGRGGSDAIGPTDDVGGDAADAAATGPGAAPSAAAEVEDTLRAREANRAR